MKIKIKNFVFAGFAAAMFAGVAHAELIDAGPYDLDNEHNLNYVTSKQYVDRVVTNATGAVEDGIVELGNRVDAAESDIESLQTAASNISSKQDKTDSAVSSTDANDAATGGLLTAGQGVGNNLVSIATQATTNKNNISTINTTLSGYGDVVTHNASDFADASETTSALADKQDASDSAVSSTAANDASTGGLLNAGQGVGDNLVNLATQVTTNIGDITTLQGQVSDLQTAASNIDSKQDKTDSAVSSTDASNAATGGLLTAGQGVGANLVSVATQATTNKADIATINSSAVMTSGIDSTKVAQIATNASNITALQSGKEDKTNKTTTGLITTDNDGNITAVAAGTADAYASTSAISSDLTKVKDAITAANGVASGLNGRLTTAEGEINALQAADTTLQNNIGGKQDKSTADYQMGNSSGTWTAMSTAQQNALNSGIVASTCSANAPCAWINNAWVPIQQ